MVCVQICTNTYNMELKISTIVYIWELLVLGQTTRELSRYPEEIRGVVVRTVAQCFSATACPACCSLHWLIAAFPNKNFNHKRLGKVKHKAY